MMEPPPPPPPPWPYVRPPVDTVTGVFAIYMSADESVREPLFVGVRVIVPAVVGVIVKVCAALELAKVRTIGESPNPAVGVMVIVPVY